MATALEITNLHKTYSNGHQALKGISFAVQQGDFFALLGPNGAGKSTTIGIICALVNKTSGQVKIFGDDMDQSPNKVKQHLGVVPQEFNFNQFEKTADILITQAGYYGIPYKESIERAEHYLHKLGLWEKRGEQSRLLSGGMKRRLMIARALIHQPKLLILDEPTAGVDIELRRSMWDFLQEINQQGITIILTTHYLEEAEQLCRNIAIIDHGRLVQNTSMKALLRTLHMQTFIFDATTLLPDQLSLSGYTCRRLDDHSFEVDVDHEQDLNELFNQFSAQKLAISSMRNKANRLEELFVSLVDKNLQR